MMMGSAGGVGATSRAGGVGATSRMEGEGGQTPDRGSRVHRRDDQLEAAEPPVGHAHVLDRLEREQVVGRAAEHRRRDPAPAQQARRPRAPAAPRAVEGLLELQPQIGARAHCVGNAQRTHDHELITRGKNRFFGCGPRWSLSKGATGNRLPEALLILM